MVRKLGGSTLSVCRKSLECWVPCTCTTDWKILKKRNFTCTSYSSYKRYQRMMLAMQRKVFMVLQPFRTVVVLDNPLYDATLRKGAWSRLLYYYFPLACYSNHLPCLSLKYCLYPVEEEGKRFQTSYTTIYMAPYCRRLQSAHRLGIYLSTGSCSRSI